MTGAKLKSECAVARVVREREREREIEKRENGKTGWTERKKKKRDERELIKRKITLGKLYFRGYFRELTVRRREVLLCVFVSWKANVATMKMREFVTT